MLVALGKRAEGPPTTNSEGDLRSPEEFGQGAERTELLSPPQAKLAEDFGGSNTIKFLLVSSSNKTRSGIH